MRDADFVEAVDTVLSPLLGRGHGAHYGSMYYDKDTNPITREEWVALFEHREEYSRVAAEDVGEYWVSTVWLGLNHAWDGGPPLIFETMWFRDGESVDLRRYTTLEQAKAGHKAVVARLRMKQRGTGEEE